MDAPFQTGPVLRRHRIRREATATNVGRLKYDAETWLRFVLQCCGCGRFPAGRQTPARLLRAGRISFLLEPWSGAVISL